MDLLIIHRILWETAIESTWNILSTASREGARKTQLPVLVVPEESGREEKLQHSFCRFSREPLFQDEMGTNELCSFSLEEIILRSRGGPPNLNYLTLLCYFLTLPPWGSLQLFCLTEWEDKGLIPVNLAWIPGQLKKCHWLDLRCWGENGQSQRWTTKWHLVLMPTWHGQWWFLT